MAPFPAPETGILLTHFIVAETTRSRATRRTERTTLTCRTPSCVRSPRPAARSLITSSRLAGTRPASWQSSRPDRLER